MFILVPLVVAEVYVENLPNPSRDKHLWMKGNSRRVTTLILGNSQPFYGVRPEMLPGVAYNLAQVSQTYRYDDYLLRHYSTDSLRNVILGFSYFSLYEDFENMPGEQYLGIRYRIYMDCDIHPRLGYYGFEFSSINSLTEKLRSIWEPSHLAWDSLGRGTDYTLTARPEVWDTGESAAANNTYSDTTLVALNTALLDGIMNYCCERNINLVLFNHPLTASFRKAQSADQCRRNSGVLNTLLRKYPEVVYLDLTADSSFTDSDFYDSFHVNEYGAARLTRILAQYLK